MTITTSIHPSRVVRATAFALSLMIMLGVSVPAFAATSTKPAATATLTTSSFSFPTGARIAISGTTLNTTKVRFTVTASTTTKTLFKSKTLKVTKGIWSGTVTKKKLADGTYTVTVFNADGSHREKLIQGTLVVGQPEAILKVSSIALLSGGSAQPGQTVPVSYLQVQNLSSSTVAIRGFWLTQAGTAGDSSVVGFSSVDGSGGSRASTTDSHPLSKGKAYVPSTAVLAPHERKLFTLKAQISPSQGAYAGQTLGLNVSGIDADAQFNATFPILGTTWVIAR